jgi:hypothetical protein
MQGYNEKSVNLWPLDFWNWKSILGQQKWNSGQTIGCWHWSNIDIIKKELTDLKIME